MKITELKGNPQVLNTVNGDTLRLNPREVVTGFPEKNISNEMRIAESMRLILIEDEKKAFNRKKVGGNE